MSSEHLVRAGALLGQYWLTFASLLLLAATMAAYKKWIPNTNFETASNWDKERIPCARDTIHFEKDEVVSVFVRSTHALTDMYLPLNGEFLLASGSGFAAFDGSWDPGCAVLSFANAEQHSWFNPELWQDVSSRVPAGRIFLLDEERVPCQYDRVIFQPETSFRVNLDSSRQEIPVQSISLMGQELSSAEAWAEYLRSPSAAWQFHGNATLQVTGTRCPHSSGCACGNSQDGDRICASLLRAERCPALACHSPLRPLGHCCGVCGEWGPLSLCHFFENKKHAAQTFLGLLPRGSTPVIQIVLVDGEAGVQTGSAAEQLAADIMGDIAQHGEALGIPAGSVEVATGSTLGGQMAIHASRQIALGTVLGLLFTLLVLGGLLYVHRKGKLRYGQGFCSSMWLMLDIRKNVFSEGVAVHWHRLPREVGGIIIPGGVQELWRYSSEGVA
uniref:Protein amnionless n=1 Tax=Phasianus colchicus TaxID=9054 RepID=A0A669PIU3_PHACC